MPTKYPQAAGAYSTRTWYDARSGGGTTSAPGAGDILDLNGLAITCDVTTLPASGTLTAIQGYGAGALTIPMNTLAANTTINTRAINADSTTPPIVISGTDAHLLTITGLTGTGVKGGSGTSGFGINKQGTCALTLTGTGTILNGGSGLLSHGMRNDAASGTVTINGNVSGGSNGSSYGYYPTAGAAFTINGDSIGGSGSKAVGVLNYLSNTAVLNGSMITSATANAWEGQPPSAWTPVASTSPIQRTIGGVTTRYAAEPTAGNVLKDVVVGSITGTFDEAARNTDPGVANVITGTSYKIANTTKNGTHKTEATSKEEQLSVDVAVVTSNAKSILNGTTILGIDGAWFPPDPRNVMDQCLYGPLTGIESGWIRGLLTQADPAKVLHTESSYGLDRSWDPDAVPLVPALHASDIANCTEGNVIAGVTIDDVVGTAGAQLVRLVFGPIAHVEHG